MSKPDEIPQDVWNAASGLGDVVPEGPGDTFTTTTGDVARAILAERERCAQVVERNPDLATGSYNSIRAVQSIAATIRKGGHL